MQGLASLLNLLLMIGAWKSSLPWQRERKEREGGKDVRKEAEEEKGNLDEYGIRVRSH